MTRQPEPPRLSRNLAGMTTVLAGGVYALMIIGSYVAGAGYSLSCSGWPLCNGQLVPTSGGTDVQTIFTHRLLALAVGLLLLAMTWLAWRARQRDGLIAHALGGAVVLYVVQALVGAANIWTQLADWVAALHLALGAALWVTVVILNIRAHRLYELLPRVSNSQNKTDLAGATR
jgi:heme A synthase